MSDTSSLYALCLEHGVFLRREAVAVGIDDRTINRALRSGHIVRVRHGAYIFTDLWRPLDDRGRHVVRMRAVMRTHSGAVMATHHTAAVMHGMDLWSVPLERIHVTRLDGLTGRTVSDVTHHRGQWRPEDVVSRDGVLVSTPARAALESASLSGVEPGLVTVDSGLRQGLFTREDMTAHHEVMSSWPDFLKVQLVTRLADGRSESAGETRARYLFWRAGIPAPILQYPVMNGQALLGIADFAWPEHGVLGEFDGRIKYERYAREGERPGDVVFREKQREDLMRAATGWRFYRLTWSMLDHAARTSAQLRALLGLAA